MSLSIICWSHSGVSATPLSLISKTAIGNMNFEFGGNGWRLSWHQRSGAIALSEGMRRSQSADEERRAPLKAQDWCRSRYEFCCCRSPGMLNDCRPSALTASSSTSALAPARFAPVGGISATRMWRQNYQSEHLAQVGLG